MKKILALLMALSLILYGIAPAKAATLQTITGTRCTFLSVRTRIGGSVKVLKDIDTRVENTLSIRYAYEEIDAVEVGRFVPDQKIALITVEGFESFKGLSAAERQNAEVFINGELLQANGYLKDVGHSFTARRCTVTFPVELTETGGIFPYEIEVRGEAGGMRIAEQAQIVIRLLNTSPIKKTERAQILSIESDAPKRMEAYCIGDKIFLDYAADADDARTVKITFGDETGQRFERIVWANETRSAAGKGEEALICRPGGGKLSQSQGEYLVRAQGYECQPKRGQAVIFILETEDCVYETEEYTLVVHEHVPAVDPKGIRFAESEQTIEVGERYRPLVLGVATERPLAADELRQEEGTAVLDIEEGEVIGTKPGVTLLTAVYTVGETGKSYTASQRITVAEKEASSRTTRRTVTGGTLNVRREPRLDGERMGQLHRGERVVVISVKNGWAQLEGGGFVAVQYLS